MKYGLLLAFSTIIVVSGCGGKNEYPAAEVTNFMNGCLANGGNPKYCSCILDKVQRKYTFKEFNDMSVEKFIDSTKSMTMECQK